MSRGELGHAVVTQSEGRAGVNDVTGGKPRPRIVLSQIFVAGGAEKGLLAISNLSSDPVLGNVIGP
jgi:hypothetical protein